MEFNKQEIIERLKFFRTRAGLSQRELSGRLGLGNSYINSIESGKTALRIDALDEICKVLGISIFFFFYLGEIYNEDQKQIIDDLFKLKSEEQALITNMIKSLKDKKK